MNYWTRLSCEFAQQRNYLDELFKVYPITPNLRRVLPKEREHEIIMNFIARDNKELIKSLLKNELFPIKDSYVSYLKNDLHAIELNPNTVNRIAGNLYDLGIDKIIENSTAPKENNRQMGPAFKRWIETNPFGVPIIEDALQFLNNEENCLYNASDAEMKSFANQHLGYNRNKGIDFIAKFNGKYVIGEAKFLTDFGGHQNAQFDDAMSTLKSLKSITNKNVKNEVVPIAILDGVLYIENNSKLHNAINSSEDNIMSALVLREFLYSL